MAFRQGRERGRKAPMIKLYSDILLMGFCVEAGDEFGSTIGMARIRD